MKYNKILRKLISTIGLPFSLLSYISTAIIGLIGIIPLLGWILSVVLELFFAIVFIWPLMGISWVFLKLRFMRPFFGLVGVIHSFFAYAIAVLLPSFGDNDERMMRLLFCFSFPYNTPLYLLLSVKELPSDYFLAKDLQDVIMKTIPISPQMALYVRRNISDFPWIPTKIMQENNPQELTPQTQSSSAKMTTEELLKKHGIKTVQKTGAILMPLSKGQREAMQKIKQTNTD